MTISEVTAVTTTDLTGSRGLVCWGAEAHKTGARFHNHAQTTASKNPVLRDKYRRTTELSESFFTANQKLAAERSAVFVSTTSKDARHRIPPYRPNDARVASRLPLADKMFPANRQRPTHRRATRFRCANWGYGRLVTRFGSGLDVDVRVKLERLTKVTWHRNNMNGRKNDRTADDGSNLDLLRTAIGQQPAHSRQDRRPQLSILPRLTRTRGVKACVWCRT